MTIERTIYLERVFDTSEGCYYLTYLRRSVYRSVIEKSQEQADILKQMQLLSLQLDHEYLEQCYKEMEASHSWRDSAVILSPNPTLTMDKQELEAVKLRQLRCYLDLARNTKSLIQAEGAFARKRNDSRKLEELFGM